MKRAEDDDLDWIARQWVEQGVSEDLTPMKLIGRLLRLVKVLEAAQLRCHGAFGLGQGEFDVLATLRRAGAPHCLTPSQLYQSMLLSSGAMTNRLDRLERKGLIERRHSEEDRRSVKVHLTRPGLELIDRALPVHLQNMRDLLDGVGTSERDQLEQLLKLWLGRLADH
ncbi:MarR family winged helix-turn-helix transcriptional regulator [Microbulbifer litoralis]|uniref:MarR family winged helix-turn-helix transcriptional regulator n=1 Tax=Microbulbifer litoralis TaxID=2933965 RepID=UPI002027BB17|nr:MarR family transcriptional regulator [Microbulbifer sp. GX H0434]